MFQNKTVLITGAAVGIGRACAVQFAKNGANVVLVDYNPDTLKTAEEEIRSITENVLAIVCDVSDPEAVQRTVRESEVRFGNVDILVNNAALWRSFSPFHEMDII